MKRVIFLTGPPKAGKSRVRGEIYKLLRKSGFIKWFVLPVSPDSEGQWVSDCYEISEKHGQIAKEIARKYKEILKSTGNFYSQRWLEGIIEDIKGLLAEFNILVLDMGGIPDEQKENIVNSVIDHARIIPVILTLKGDDGGWISFWKKFNIDPISNEYSQDFVEYIYSKIVEDYYENKNEEGNTEADKDKLKIEVILRKERLETEELDSMVRHISELLKNYQPKILIISGRLPVWAFGSLIYAFKDDFETLAIYEPRLRKGVIVGSKNGNIGETVDTSDAQNLEIYFP